jgi:hypothetical protein
VLGAEDTDMIDCVKTHVAETFGIPDWCRIEFWFTGRELDPSVQGLSSIHLHHCLEMVWY